MKKKLIASISAVAAVSASFWACGDGNINPMLDPGDTQFNYMDENEFASVRDDALQSCRNDIGCYMHYKAYLDGDEPIEEPVVNSSDDSGSNQNPNPVFSSSSRGEVIIVTNPSSSSVLVFNPDPVSSSSGIEIVPVSGLGSCKAASASISKGQSVAWKFTPNGSNTKYTAMQFASQADYKWNFGGLADDGSGVRATSGKVTYMNSGVANASVTVTMPDGASEVINCTPLQVDGDPITGCKCAPVGVTGSVNFLETPDVSWTVSGCVSASEVNSYTWDGTPGEATFTKTFTAEAKSYAPTLKVGNADKTVVDVTCSAVKVTEGAEYTIKDNTDAGKISLPAAGTYNVVIAFACQNRTFFCNGVGGPVGGSVNGTTMKSDWYTTAALTAADCTGSATVSVEVTGPATCGAQ